MPPELTLQQRLASLFERDMDTLDGEKIKLATLYETIEKTLTHTSRLSGIEPLLLVRLCVETAWHSTMKWYEVLMLQQSFYASKARMEKEQQEG